MTTDETAVETAEATAGCISGLPSHFMLAGSTYAASTEAGYNGIDFYFGGRGGVLGDVDADVVAAALVFFNPAVVRPAWEASGAVASRAATAQAWAGAAERWAKAHLAEGVDWARLAELAGMVVAAANPAGAPLFAGWRALPVPADPRAAALHQLNALRELRMARHGVAVLAEGLALDDLVRYRSPAMAGLFGWATDVATPAGIAEGWARAEACTNRLVGADLAALDTAQHAEFVALCTAATTSTV